MSEARGENAALQRRLEETSGEAEKLSLQLAEVTGNAATNATSATKRNEALQKMVNLLEADLDRRQRQLKETEDRLSRLEKEHESYKVVRFMPNPKQHLATLLVVQVRAQSVLRQSKEAEENEAAAKAKQQEVAALERLVQSLNEKIADLK